MCSGMDVRLMMLMLRHSSKDQILPPKFRTGPGSALPPTMSRRAMHHAASLSALIMQVSLSSVVKGN